jgi:hypothetical protein
MAASLRRLAFPAPFSLSSWTVHLAGRASCAGSACSGGANGSAVAKRFGDVGSWIFCVAGVRHRIPGACLASCAHGIIGPGGARARTSQLRNVQKCQGRHLNECASPMPESRAEGSEPHRECPGIVQPRP